MISNSGQFRIANPHVMAAIVKAGEAHPIVAAMDIVDVHGTKLWAASKTVTRALQERLLARKLRDPIETCLRSDNGVTAAELAELACAFAKSQHPLAAIVAPHIDAVAAEVKSLPLQPAVALLLTAARDSQRDVFDHAVRAMTLAGTMYEVHPLERYPRRLVLLGGLLHDIGYMYLHPAIVATSSQDDLQAFRQIAAHPSFGRMIVEHLTNYPEELAIAIDEHHERLDGSGYPNARNAASITDLGKLLAVNEIVVSIAVEGSPTPIASAELALRFVSAELEQRWTTMFHPSDEEKAALLAAHSDTPNVVEALAEVSCMLDAAQKEAQSIVAKFTARAGTAGAVADSTLRRLKKLRVAWAETGLWGLPADATSVVNTDGPALIREMRFRIRQLQREIALRSANLGDSQTAPIYRLQDLLTWQTPI